MRCTPVLILALSLALTACGSKTPPAWQPYQQAEAVAGQGLGDLRLGSQRLGNLVDQFGVERVAGWFSDEDNGIELIYSSVGLHFLFPVDGECARTTRQLGPRLIREMYQASEFLARYPACRDLRLSSIVITSGLRSAWWQGSTHRGSRLGDLWPEVLTRHGTAQRDGGSYLPQTAGENLESLLYAEGMELYFRTLARSGSDGYDRLMMPLSHIRLWQP
ncbi:MAG: hypothetical protein JJU31_14450 [Wenzhouxiangella sp.]|nr:hypothetical protein [Wenzhouxiangella sp.]MCH8478969.1 hypothetical protein [Wenzhouxiangella sp.]TVR93709.1 MAG: hypothetical protein EA418_11645 [Wenzhouxiangellaceae bacterium]